MYNSITSRLIENPINVQVSYSVVLHPLQFSGLFSEEFMTIADTVSISSPNGYVLEAVVSYTDSGLTISISSITRISYAIETY